MLWLFNTMNWIDVTIDAIRKNLSIENVIYFLHDSNRVYANRKIAILSR